MSCALTFKHRVHDALGTAAPLSVPLVVKLIHDVSLRSDVRRACRAHSSGPQPGPKLGNAQQAMMLMKHDVSTLAMHLLCRRIDNFMVNSSAILCGCVHD